MSVTAGQVMDDAAALLADPEKITFSYVYQLPYIRIAWKTLQNILLTNGTIDVREVTSAPVTITANTKEWTSGVPSDLLYPTKLWEKGVGEPVTSLIEMDQVTSEPNEEQTETLENWWYEEGVIKFKGCNVDRDVVMRYQKELVTIANENTLLPSSDVIAHLSHKTAAIISFVRGNKGRADALEGLAAFYLDNTISNKVKEQQAYPVRPKPYGYSRRARRSSRLI